MFSCEIGGRKLSLALLGFMAVSAYAMYLMQTARDAGTQSTKIQWFKKLIVNEAELNFSLFRSLFVYLRKTLYVCNCVNITF